MCGDMNCPGSDCNGADDDLTSLFDSFGFNQHANTPTRGDNLLDVLATEDRIAYRHQCRTANKIINQARRDHNSQHINFCTDSKSR